MASRARRLGAQTASAASIPAPIGGWNAQDAIANMEPQYAVTLDNWIPRPGYVETRRGSKPITTNIPAPVESVLVWRGSTTGVDQVFGAAGGAIYANSGGNAGPALVSGLSSSRWKYVNFSNTGGSYIVAFSGSDTSRKYDGSSWTTNTITGPADAAKLNDAVVYQRRIFLSEQGTLSLWYLDVDAIAGAANELPLGSYFALGGTIAALGCWTTDGLQGSNDCLVVVTTEGQVAVFQGTDPSDADLWSLIGVYTLAKPLGNRSLISYGADLVILTYNGVLPMSQAAQFDRAQDSTIALTAKIQNAFASATALYGTNFGWEAFLYPNSQLAIYNIPITVNNVSYQYVQNMQTGAWCRFLGVNALCWAYANGKAYFGTADSINEFDTGAADSGIAITCDMTCAFNGLNRVHTEKQFTMLRPILQVSAPVAVAVDTLVDYQSGTPVNTPNYQATGNGMVWGSMVWGSMVWGDGLSIRKDWASASGLGYVCAPRMRVVTGSSAIYSDVLMEDGTPVLMEDGVDTVLMEDVLYPETPVQAIGFNVMYNEGSLL